MNVRFFNVKLLETYLALEHKDPAALYFIQDAQRLYQGDKLIGVGDEASETADGLLSAEGYAKLQELIATVPTIEERLASVEGAIVGGVHYKGSVPTVNDLPADAKQGDLYEIVEDNSEWCFNGEKWFEYGHTVDFSLVAGNGIAVAGKEISIKIADEAHGLVVDENGLAMQVATAEQDGAISKEDKTFIGSIPTTYSTIDRVNETCIQKKFDVSGTPEGTLVNYSEDEIRIMVPADAKFVKQAVGAGGDANTYYMTLKTYAPNDNVVGYIEHLNDQVDSEILMDLKTDEHGRKYQPSWLGLAVYNEASDAWTYYGASSTDRKYIGWNYQIDWYDANGKRIAVDHVRINLSNESCHDVAVPYYMTKYATKEEVESVATWESL